MPPENSRRDGSCRIGARSRSSSDWLHLLTMRSAQRNSACVIAGEPRIWEFAGETNAVLRRKGLLSVAGQHLTAARGQLGAALLQTCQNGEIALIHQGTAKPLHVA